MKITRADKNMKNTFKEMKKILEKPPANIVFNNCTKKVQAAMDAEKRETYVPFLYECYCEAKDLNANSHFVQIREFIPFVKFFLKDISQEAATDIYMSLNGVLQKIKSQLDSPNMTRMIAEMDDRPNKNDSFGRASDALYGMDSMKK